MNLLCGICSPQERGDLWGAPFLLLLSERTMPGRKPLLFFFFFVISRSCEIPGSPMDWLEHAEVWNCNGSSRMEFGVIWPSSSSSEPSIRSPSNWEKAKSDSSNLYRMLDRSSPWYTMWSTCCHYMVSAFNNQLISYLLIWT